MTASKLLSGIPSANKYDTIQIFRFIAALNIDKKFNPILGVE